MPRRMVLPVIVGLLLYCAAGRGATWEVSSTPPGAEVWACPTDQPVAYLKGVTPCRVEAAEEVSALVLRLPGYFPAYPEVPRAGGVIAAVLQAKNDLRAWAQVPAIVPEGEGWDEIPEGRWPVISPEGTPCALTGFPGFLREVAGWAPDGRALLARGDAWGGWVSRKGLALEDGIISDLWWVPLSGTPVQVWRWVGDPEVPYRFWLSGAVAPGNGWVVHEAPVGEREYIRLWRRATATSRVIADETGGRLYDPRLSPSGRLVVCILDAAGDEGEEGHDLALMHWNGSGRRALGVRIDGQIPAAFSPEESLVAYAGAGGELCVAPLAGGKGRVLLGSSGWKVADSPRWSPTGRRVAATMVPADRNREGPGVGEPKVAYPRRVVWADLRDGSSGTILAATLEDWADDEHLIARVAGWVTAAGAVYTRLVSVNLQGDVEAVLWEAPAVLYGPAISPDGKQVAALARRPGGAAVFLYDEAAEKGRFVSAGQVAELSGLAWAGEHLLLFTGSEEGRAVTWRLDTQSGALDRAQSPPEVTPYAGIARYACLRGDLWLMPQGAEASLRTSLMESGETQLTWFNAEPEFAPVPGEVGRQ